MIHLITLGNPQGYLADYLVRSLAKTEVKTTHCRTFNLSDYNNVYDTNTEVLIFLGVPFTTNQTDMLLETLGDVLTPFSKVIHINSYGDTISVSDLMSHVDEVSSPCKVLLDLLENTNDDILVNNFELDKSVLEVVQGYVSLGDSYHQGLFTSNEPITPKIFNDILLHYQDLSFSFIQKGRPLTQFHIEERLHIDAVIVNRSTYLERQIKKIKVEVVNGCIVAFTYSEKYGNEIADWVILQYQGAGFKQIIVLVGDHTIGDDRFAIRTYGVNAKEVAHVLNKGGGKERTASVFLGDSTEATFTVVKRILSTKLL